MTATATPVEAPDGGLRAGRDAAAPAVRRLAARQIRRSSCAVTLVVAGLSALVAVQYQQSLADTGAVASLETLAENPAIRTLFGVPVALDDPGGFTVWRTGTPVAILVGAWALLAATRITRGEEDAGRWALLLAGPLTARDVLRGHLLALFAATGVVGAVLALALTAAGTRASGAVLYGVGITSVGAFFAAAAAAAAQLLPDRRAAAGLTAAALVFMLLLRMVADSATALSWLSWVTPFGLLATAQPYAGMHIVPALVLVAFTAVLTAAAVALAGSRDTGAGRLPVRSDRAPRTRLLRSLPRFAVRRTLPSALAWAGGLIAYFLLIGSLADSLTTFLRDNPQFAELAAQAGFADLTRVEGYVASLFAVLAVPIGLFAASRIGADAADEAAGRFTLVFSAPVSRRRWAVAHWAVLVATSLALAAAAGLATWIGTSTAGAGLSLSEAVAGAVTVLPVSLVCLGAALLALGWAPSKVLPAGATPVVGGFLIDVLADTFAWPRWVASLSPFQHIAPVPAAEPDWPGAVLLLVVATALTVLGVVGYQRRDLTG